MLNKLVEQKLRVVVKQPKPKFKAKPKLKRTNQPIIRTVEMPVTGFKRGPHSRHLIEHMVQKGELYVFNTAFPGYEPLDPNSKYCKGHALKVIWRSDTEVFVEMRVAPRLKGMEFNQWQLTFKQSIGKDGTHFNQPYILIF